MIKVEHAIESMPSEFADTRACGVQENGTLVIYDQNADYALAGFAAGTWASFQIGEG